jgi:hypothetical protein
MFLLCLLNLIYHKRQVCYSPQRLMKWTNLLVSMPTLKKIIVNRLDIQLNKNLIILNQRQRGRLSSQD